MTITWHDVFAGFLISLAFAVWIVGFASVVRFKIPIVRKGIEPYWVESDHNPLAAEAELIEQAQEDDDA